MLGLGTTRRIGRRTLLACAAAAPLAGLTPGARADDESSRGPRFVCTTPDCAPYVYDPDLGNPSQGVAPGTPFEDLPDTWRCPSCGSGRDAFVRIG